MQLTKYGNRNTLDFALEPFGRARLFRILLLIPQGYLQKTRNGALASCEDSDKYNQQQEEEMNNCVSQIEETSPGTDEKQVFDHSKQQKNQNRQVRRNNERMDQGTERNESLPFSKIEIISTDAVIDKIGRASCRERV